MEKDKIFFSEQGLTMTSSNHIANLCKEAYRSLEEKLSSMVFFTTTIQLLGGGEERLLRSGLTTTSNIGENIIHIAKLKSLIAWLREAIKAKERLLDEINNSTYKDYGIEVPEAPQSVSPLTEDEYISTWNIKKRNRYYFLETLCATIGQYIHKGGPYAIAREALQEAINEPHTLKGEGRDAILYTCTPSLPAEEVEDTYMHLQNIYREYQAELNSLKHEIQTAIQKDTIAKNAEYSQLRSEYYEKVQNASAELALKKKEAEAAVFTLKIVIPDSLKDIYEKVSQLGK